MKNTIKNIAAVIMISGLFFVPVFCSAQVNGVSGSNDDNYIVETPSPPGAFTIYDSQVEDKEEEEYQTALIEAQLQIIFNEQNGYSTLSSTSAARHAVAMMIIRNLK